MAQIQTGVERVLAAVGDMSASLREQSSTSNLIAGNVERIAQMTEETGGVVQDVAASADRLAKLADALKQSVGQFKL